MITSAATIYTVGHSNHAIGHFIALLQGAEITALADVRSRPYSRFCLHFNQKQLQAALVAQGIAYVYLGNELGGKPAAPELYSGDRPDYGKITAWSFFQQGVDRLMATAEAAPTAIMCAERDPLQCHRTHLIAPALVARGINVCHVLADGSLMPHGDLPKPAQANLFT